VQVIFHYLFGLRRVPVPKCRQQLAMFFYGIFKSSGKIQGLKTIEQDLFPESLDDLIQCPVTGQFLDEGVVPVVDADVFFLIAAIEW
jgi:hypothetical protein